MFTIRLNQKFSITLLYFLWISLIDWKALCLEPLCRSLPDLKPCKFSQNSIFCDNIRGNFNLDNISSIVDTKCTNGSFYEFSLYNSSAEKIGNVFESVSFKLISITNNQNLSSISEKAFAGSEDSLSIINVIENHNLSDSETNHSSILEWITMFREVDYIIIHDNGINELTNQLFTNDKHRFQQLSYINLYHNNISRIESKSFVDLIEIKSINLGQNQIGFIDESAFVLSPNITSAQISIDRNKLDSTSFASNWFAIKSDNTSAKIVIDLSHNNISYLDQHIFKNILDHNYDIDLILDDNPFQCDCRAKWLIIDRDSYKNKVRAECPDRTYFWVKTEKDFQHCNSTYDSV